MHKTHSKQLKQCGTFLETDVAKNLFFGGLTFGRKIKSTEISSNFKFTHNVDYDIIKIINAWNFIYFIVAIKKKENISTI